ncbi:TetR/AcrR family transcriptional regulator [Flammeovirga kamogawensis]|uniref:TetR/AcrR family transcriptional regulator n=1 Tax=Flammeovirga kamogawensis TaxID=373891 RepID=A0ABX8GWG8_9BACT|nr:TetR/AcrR family transcriptional regulator [Flammeovirga kamogawensis]MBB6461179.1 AcrR family transcriptional regulator [Flammeovirga kamogawensis]QWG07743.1 TetR/AcrR family transcriptional regulator [Flammeovirga kamogawensis]TRX69549.1 TetR/AcrR family transcriptional regulator [Flammeovirga kamogawensis]
MDSKDKILEVAKDIFQKKGKSGARMQEIADAAGVNKALVHYYFKNKEGLFQEVFQDLIRKTIFPIVYVLRGPEPLEDKISQFIDLYIDTLKENPNMVTFIIGELQMNKAPFTPSKEMQDTVISIGKQLQEDPNFISIHPLQFMTTLLGSCIFPFIAKPMFTNFDQIEPFSFDEFIEERKSILHHIILNGIKSNNNE